MTLLDISARESGGVTHVTLSGELDLSTVPRVDQELERVEDARPATIALDLSGLTFLDSSGLRAIVAADKRARRADRRLVVVRGPETIQRVFEITRLDDQLELVDDVAELNGG